MKTQSAAVVENGCEKKGSAVRETIKSFLIALVLALLIRTFVVQPFQIPSGSMEHTLEIGDYILVNKFIYGTRLPFLDSPIMKVRDPARGDVIVFEFPEDKSKDFIKRVVGLPGDRIRIVDKKVIVNSVVEDNPHAIHNTDDILPGVRSPRDNTETITVPADAYFVMGDNRDSSYDSRFWGFVKRGSIKGLAFVKHWSWDSEEWRIRWNRIGRPIP